MRRDSSRLPQRPRFPLTLEILESRYAISEPLGVFLGLATLYTASATIGRPAAPRVLEQSLARQPDATGSPGVRSLERSNLSGVIAPRQLALVPAETSPSLAPRNPEALPHRPLEASGLEPELFSPLGQALDDLSLGTAALRPKRIEPDSGVGSEGSGLPGRLEAAAGRPAPGARTSTADSEGRLDERGSGSPDAGPGGLSWPHLFASASGTTSPLRLSSALPQPAPPPKGGGGPGDAGNPSPTLQAFNPEPATEGATTGNRVWASFTNCQGTLDQYTATIDWGAGVDRNLALQANTTTGCGGNVVAAHTYAEEKAYTITITVSGNGVNVSQSVGIMVEDAPLIGIPQTIHVQESKRFGTDFPYTVVASFRDTNPTPSTDDVFTAAIDWGDGRASAGAAVYNSTTRNWDVQGSGVYAEEGTYPITVLITEFPYTHYDFPVLPNGSRLTVHSTAQVDDVPLTGQAGLYACRGIPWTGSVGSLNEGIFDPTSDFRATIDWGDGSGISPGTIVEPNGIHQPGAAWGGLATVFSARSTHTYSATGTYPTTVTFTDLHDGQTLSVQGTAQVTDWPPHPPDPNVTVNVQNLTGLEGSTLNALGATFSDNTQPPRVGFGYQIDWGDNSFATSSTTNPGQPIVASHTYYEDGVYTITVSISSPDQIHVTTGTATATITEAPVTDATLTSTFTGVRVNEGQTFNGAVTTFSDPNPNARASDFTAQIDWGDGQLPSDAIVQAHPGGGFEVRGTKTYDEESYDGNRIAVTVTHNVPSAGTGGPRQTFFGTATVTDPPLAIMAANPLMATQNQALTNMPVATFMDPDTAEQASLYQATIDWGDGQNSTGTVSGAQGNFQVTGTHTYAQAGHFVIRVAVADDGRYNESEKILPVDVAPAGSAGTLMVTANRLTTNEAVPLLNAVVATFTDSDPSHSNYLASIDWGDHSSPTAGTIESLGAQMWRVKANHLYSEEGTFPVTVTITPQGGAPVTTLATAAVADPPLTNVTGTQLRAALNVPLDKVLVATFTDPLGTHPATDYYAIIYWGEYTSYRASDSVGTVCPGPNGTFYVTGDHTYIDDPFFPIDSPVATYTLRVTIYDDDVVKAQVTSAVTVVHSMVGLMATVAAQPMVGPLGNLRTAVFNNASSSPDSIWSIQTDFGDGSPPTPPTDYFPQDVAAHDTAITQQHIFRKRGLQGQHRVTYRDDPDPSVTASAANQLLVVPARPIIKTTDPLVVGKLGQPLQSTGQSQNPLGRVALALFTTADPDADAGDFKATIVWGDNAKSSPGEIERNPDGTYLIWGEHTYYTPGSLLITILLKDHQTGTILTLSCTQVAIADDLTLYQRLPGTLVSVGTGPDTDGGWAYTAPNTGDLFVPLPLDFRLNHDASRDGFIDFQGNPLQGLIAGDGRHRQEPAGTSPGLPGFSDLIYSSGTVQPRPIGEVEVPTDKSRGVPTQISAQLTFNHGTPQNPRVFTTTGHAPGDTYLVGDQVAAPIAQSGVYPWSLRVQVTYPDNSTSVREENGKALVVVNDNSPFGAGWTLAGLNQLIAVPPDPTSPNDSGGMLMLYGSGAAPRFFTQSGSGTYTSPADDFGTLTQNTSDGSYTYTSKYGIHWNFDSTGLLQTIQDPHNLAVTFTYAGGQLSTIALPDGGVTSFSSTSIQEPGGRTLTLGIDQSNNLTAVTDVDGTLRGFSYDNQHRLTNESWPPLSATFTYDPSYGTLASVDRGLGTVWNQRPSNLVALQNTAGQPADAVAQITNPRSFVSTYTLDPLGWLTQLDTPDQSSQSWTRDPSEQVNGYTDQLGQSTLYLNDSDKGDVLQISYPDNGTELFQYENTFHRRTQSVDANGNPTQYAYDAQSNLITITDALGKTTTQMWSSSGLLTSVTDRRGNTTNYQFDSGSRRLTSMTDPQPATTNYTYDAAGYRQTVQDPLLHTTTTLNDPRGRVTQTTAADGGVTSLSYNSIGEVTQRSDPLRHTTAYQYDQRGWRTAVTDALTRTTTTAYDPAGNATSVTDANNHTTLSAYDPVNRPTTSTDANTNVTTMLYDPVGNVTGVTDADNHTTTSAYDPVNRRTLVQDALNNTTATAYDSVGNVLSVTDANGHTTAYAYDGLSRRTTAVDALGNTTTTRYDAEDNATLTLDALGRPTTSAYDVVNRKTTVTDALGNTTTTAYDLAGNVTSLTDANRHTTAYAYDAVNRRTLVQDALTNRTLTAYDLAGNPTAVTDANRHTTQYFYDALNRRTLVTDANNANTRTAYDPVGNVTAVTDANGHTTTSLYDPANRRTGVLDANGFLTATAYDPVGNATALTDATTHTTTSLYDAVNRRTAVEDANTFVTTTVYDNAGNVIGSIDANSHRTSYFYDGLNRRTAVQDANGFVTAMTYDAVGNVTASIDANNHPTFSAYDALNRRTTLTDAAGDVTTTRYDNVGNVTASIDPRGKETDTSYDPLNRATAVRDPDLNVTTTLYDAVGNVTVRIDALTRRTTYAYDPVNRQTLVTEPIPAPDQTLTQYDPVGNVTAVLNPNGTFSDYF
jgi:YD repeat-containing protein